MDEFVDEADTVSVNAPTLRDLSLDDTDVLVLGAPQRATTEDQWPPDPMPPAPRGPRPRRAAIFRAITESKLR